MTFLKPTLVVILLGICLVSCNSGIKTGKQLTQNDLKYFKKLGILEENETVMLFSSQLDHETSGSLITTKRLANYWQEDRKAKSYVNSAFYHEIDTVVTKDLSGSLTYASYVEVFKHGGSSFKVYVDGKPDKIQEFFVLAHSEWKRNHRP